MTGREGEPEHRHCGPGRSRSREDPDVIARSRAKLVPVTDRDCPWWTGAIRGRGHAPFWAAERRFLIAHRFAYALARGVDAVTKWMCWVTAATTRCVSALPRIGPRVDAPTEPAGGGAGGGCWRKRRWPIPRGPRRCGRELRNLARSDPADEAAALDR